MSDSSLGLGFDAVGANLNTLTLNLCPLKINEAARFYSWVIVTAQKHARGGHGRFFAAERTAGHKDKFKF
jgi:hypothetical protein